jgi:aspartate/methionine/tyrosine aminotransferase
MTGWFRDEVERQERSGIGKIAILGLDDPEVLPLWFGEGNVPTDPVIREAAKAALDEGQTFYNHPRGRLGLRTALKRYLDQLYGLDLEPDRLHLPGSTMLCVTLVAQMVLDRESHAVIVSPHWPNIKMTIDLTGAASTFVRQEADRGAWGLDLEAVFAACRPETRLLYVNSPCNPTGWVMGATDQRRLLDFCRERRIVLLADEVYHRNVFEPVSDPAPAFMTLARDDDPVVVVYGFSKAWAMTGWRLGWMVTPSGSEEQMAVLAEVYNTGPTSFAQFGGIRALEAGEPVLAAFQERIAASREVVMRLLGDHPGIELLKPEGAFYAFPRIKGISDGMAFATSLLAAEKVGVSPGYTFGPGNDAHIRICFAGEPAMLEEALIRLVRHVDRETGGGVADAGVAV